MIQKLNFITPEQAEAMSMIYPEWYAKAYNDAIAIANTVIQQLSDPAILPHDYREKLRLLYQRETQNKAMPSEMQFQTSYTLWLEKECEIWKQNYASIAPF